MSALSFLNLLLSTVHLVALATFVVSSGILIFSAGRMLSARKIKWSYPKAEVCMSVLGYSALSVWLSALPGALFLDGLPARHFSIFGQINLELLMISTGAMILIVLRAQDRYPSRKKLITSSMDSILLRVAVSVFIASFALALFQLTPDNLVPQRFSLITNDVLTSDLFIILLLTTLLVFVLLLAVNDTWVNYRFTRGRGAGSFRYAENDLNLLHSRHLR
ncbi:MAG: hypothetical protein KTR32_34430 [Granulosicoccus sp.]|nr:hypothetical protein [Granulosicoccus sp.]